MKEGELITRYRTNLAGGCNYYGTPRQIKDSESPEATNCEFKGRTGVGNRQGYTEVGTVTDSRTTGLGMATYKTSSLNQLIKFVSEGTNTALSYYTGITWTTVTSTTFTAGLDVNAVQAGGTLFVPNNGTDNQCSWDGTTLSTYTEGAKILYPEEYNNRMWGVDPTALDTLKFSTMSGDATKPLSFVSTGTSSDKGTFTLKKGTGREIRGIKSFKNALYVFCYPFGIFRLKATSTVNVFSEEHITDAVGCVSYRSIAQVGEDLFFAADDGIYSLGDVANFTEVRTTNKSARIQRVYDATSGSVKPKQVGVYHKFKYHSFYSLYGSSNDSCVPYDTRYQGWQDWRNMAANDAITWTNSSLDTSLYILNPTTAQVFKLYSGTTDNGTIINSRWKSKSFDEDLPDVVKLYFDDTFILGALNGSVNLGVIFNDSEVSVPQTITQSSPQGGYGRMPYGRSPYGYADNSITVSSVVNQPLRLKAKGQKFSKQYFVESTGDWELDAITQAFQVFGHYKFPSNLKLN